jgi:hypothetical protein
VDALHLGEPGVHAGRRLLSRAAMREMHRPQVALGGSSLDGTPFSAYGLGWSLTQYEGAPSRSTAAPRTA